MKNNAGMSGIGYKNERILEFGLDALAVSLVLVITWLLFGYPHIFNYFQEMEEAKVIISPEKYMLAMEDINARLERVIMEVFMAYFLYESLVLIFFKQTPGRRVFGRKMELNLETKHEFLMRCLIIPTRTFAKLFCIYTVIPLVVIGVVFLFSRKDKTLLDYVFLTE